MKELVTSFGLKVYLISPEEWKENKAKYESNANWMPYDSKLIEIHILNCGHGVIDAEYMTAIDDEFYLDEIYRTVASWK